MNDRRDVDVHSRRSSYVTATWLASVGHVVVFGLCFGVTACGSATDRRSDHQAVEPTLEPRLPTPPGRFAPAHTRLDPSSALTGAAIERIDSCARCHPQVYEQWSSSAHAFASFNNPVYRVSVNGFRQRVDQRASRFCAGCHDIALLVDGAMDRPIKPDDDRAHAGVNCRVCHGVSEVRNDGNGSFQLRARPIPLPRPNNPASVNRHRQAVSVRALGSDLCIACHRSFLGAATGNAHHLSGMDDAADWQRSAHAGQGIGRVDDIVPMSDCIDCHMPNTPVASEADERSLSSHRFLGGHTWLAHMRGDKAQERRVQAFLRGVISIDIAAAISTAPVPTSGHDDATRPAVVEDIRTLPADGAPLRPGGRLAVDVVMRNLGVGHRFPGGVRDAQDVWLEVTVHTPDGRLLAQSGTAHEHDPHDTEAHVLRALVANEHGDLLLTREVDAFRATIFDHTIAPRDAVVVRYTLEVPVDAPDALSITARLRHRSRNLILAQHACAEDGTTTGRAFAAHALARHGSALRPCIGQPVTDIATTSIWVGQTPSDDSQHKRDRPRIDAWRRLYEHGLAWTHAVQERLDEARPSLLEALRLLSRNDQATARDSAMVMTALGLLAGRQGRTDEALSWLDRAQESLPEHAAIASIRGAALTRVWRWRDAEQPLMRAAERAPGNANAWADLAIALGSQGKPTRALEAAITGLAIAPRHGALLRVQALSLRALDAPLAASALDAYDVFRKPDRIADIRFRCASRSDMCARERQPVHVHELRPVAVDETRQ